MTQQSLDILSPKDTIQILLHEYNGLRTEIVHRTNNMYQALAIAFAVLVWLVSRPELDWRFYVCLTAAILVIGWTLRTINRDIGFAAQRLRELETDINRRAGEPLLEWESRWGGAKTGYLQRKAPLPRAGDLGSRSASDS